MNDLQRILVASRMTAYCREAVQYGISLARKYDAKLYFVHCTHDPLEATRSSSGPLWVVAEDYKKLVIRNREDIDAVIAVEKEKGLKITELIEDADPVEVILETVRDEKIDLIVMAAHEEGRLEHFLYGRCTEEIIRKMPCSILLVKAEQAAS